MTIEIRPAKRAGSKVLLGIAGQSGSGKTLTALYIARGMVDNASEIGFLDTENGRGSFYADELDGPFMIGDLYYPFSPSRYSEAIKAFQDHGVKVLVVDSVSHEWESGCMEIAEAPLLNGKKMADWKKAKAEHKKFMTTLLQSDMHIIVCIRAAEKMDFKNPSKPVSLGIQPLCEKNFMFELTASIMMFNEGKNQQHLKIPKDLKEVYGDGTKYLGVETGRKIMQWVNAGDTNPELDSWSSRMQLAASSGTEELQKAWPTMPEHVQSALEKKKRIFWSSAKAVDELNESAKESDDSDRAIAGFNPVEKPSQPSNTQPSEPDQVSGDFDGWGDQE